MNPLPDRNHGTLVDILRYWADARGDRPALCTFADEGESGDVVTFSDLNRMAGSIAGQLMAAGAGGSRVLLLFPPGIEFAAAFLGCLCAGAVAVPSYPPAPSRGERSSGSRLISILRDASPTLVLTTQTLKPRVDGMLDELGLGGAIRTLVNDDTLYAEMPILTLQSDTAAFLQYTSGATGPPKGVLVTHRSLLHNLRLMHHAMGITEADSGVSWLPPYHDMGLIGGLLLPIYEGARMTLLSPVACLQRPIRWLQAISRTRSTVSAAPNFAYELCARKVTAEQKEGLDLSCWRVALNGAEPILPATLREFAAAFAVCGFSPRAWSPCYGMAETTLFICGGPREDKILYRNFNAADLERNRAVIADQSAYEIASCGSIPDGMHVVIVDPVTRASRIEGAVGEIWIQGDSVASGYWNRDTETQQNAHAHLSDKEEGPFLRTGDLGFMQEDELYVTGRLQDVMIIDGRTLYPQDIEAIAQQSSPGLRKGGVAAFLADSSSKPRIVVVACEVEREALKTLDLPTARKSVGEHLYSEVGIPHCDVVFLKPGTLPKTSSGKVQRGICREFYLNGSLDLVEPVASCVPRN